MNQWFAGGRLVLSVCLAAGLLAAASSDVDGGTPPNWTASASGVTVGPGDGTAPDVDSFSGVSSHLGRFTAEGYHLLDPTDFSFEGVATYTAANGDRLFVEYSGGIVGVDFNQAFPFLFVANVRVTGGTGRLAGATGTAVFSGGFTGVPGELRFTLAGTLKPQGK